MLAKKAASFFYASFMLVALICPLTSSVGEPVVGSPEDMLCPACSDRQADGTCQARTVCSSGQVLNPANGCQCECPIPCPSGQIQDPDNCSCECPSSSPCPSGQVKTLENGCTCACPADKPHWFSGMCHECPQGEYLKDGVCKKKEKCSLVQFSALVSGSEAGSDLTYKTRSGDGSKCLEDVVRDSLLILNSAEDVQLLIPGIPWTDVIKNTDAILKDNGPSQLTVQASNQHKSFDDVLAQIIWTQLAARANGVSCSRSSASKDLVRYYGCLRDGVAAKYEANKEYISCTCNPPATWCSASKDGLVTFGFGGTGVFLNVSNTIRRQTQHCLKGSFVLDQDCNLIKQAQLSAQCEASYDDTIDIQHTASTPISLLLDQSYNIHDHVSHVTFAVNPQSEKKYWTWKASAKSPLLVFDPKHSAEINSAEQLFGSWTFGGKNGSPWKNGFEPLATLDANSDGVISKGELLPLALWFDENQNGVSEKGEVRLPNSIGLTSLSFGPLHEDAANAGIEVKAGFEREEDGKKLSGRLIDWSSGGADSQLEHLAGQMLSDKITSPAESSAGERSRAASVSASDERVSGVWSWSLGEDASIERSGMFIISSDGQDVSGKTIAQIPIAVSANGKTETNTIVQFAAFSGKQRKGADARVSLEFTTDTGKGTIANSALLSADGASMKGESVATYQDAGVEKTLKYTWNAHKVDSFKMQ